MFCPQCGAITDNAFPAAMAYAGAANGGTDRSHAATVTRRAAEQRARRRRLAVGAVALATLVVAAVAILTLSDGNHRSRHVTGARGNASAVVSTQNHVATGEAREQRQAAATNRPLTAFDGQVQSLLDQSGPSYEEIKGVFEQMQTVVNGGVATITVAQAEASISSVISNRNALAASARSLAAPTQLARSVRDAMVAAFDASLRNDREIDNCLNQANYGSIAIIFESCLSSTASSSDAATAAKERFRSVYNQLRRGIGVTATTQAF